MPKQEKSPENPGLHTVNLRFTNIQTEFPSALRFCLPSVIAGEKTAAGSRTPNPMDFSAFFHILRLCRKNYSFCTYYNTHALFCQQQNFGTQHGKIIICAQKKLQCTESKILCTAGLELKGNYKFLGISSGFS